jgi:hypothetical protein
VTEPLQPELQRLVDESAIRRVLSRYSRAIDRRDYDLLRTCYHPDAVDEHGWYDGDVDGFVEYLRSGHLADFESHFLGNPHIEVEGDVAWTETYCLALHRTGVRDRLQHVRYLDRFEKRDGDWRIAHRVVSYGLGRFDNAAEPTVFGDAHVRDGRHPSDAIYRLRDL